MVSGDLGAAVGVGVSVTQVRGLFQAGEYNPPIPVVPATALRWGGDPLTWGGEHLTWGS